LRRPRHSFSESDTAKPTFEREMIFDTDVLLWACRGNDKAAVSWTPHRIVLLPSFRSWSLFRARSRVEVRQIQQSLRQLGFRIMPLSEAIGSTAAALIEQHALAHGIQVADALIAANCNRVKSSAMHRKREAFSPDPRLVARRFPSTIDLPTPARF